jgi:glycosyltransferase involved in cell wall biosynthesis
MKEKELVSIVIPAFNAQDFIRYAVKSCFYQTYRPLEVVVVNDGSTDSTFEVVRSLFNSTTVGEAQVKLLDIGQNRGAANALRVGFSRSKGAYVCWLSADDMFINRKKIEKQVAWMTRTGALWSYYRNAYQGETLSNANLQRNSYLPHLGFLDPLFINDSNLRLMLLLFRNPINGSSIMIRRDCFETFGLFDPLTRNVDPDGDLWMRYSILKLKLVAIRGAPVFYRQHSNQTSNKRYLMLRGMELTRMRILMTLEKKGVLAQLIRRVAPFFPFILATREHLAMPFVSEFVFNYILDHKRQFNRIVVKCSRKSLAAIKNHPTYLLLDRDEFMRDLEVFRESREFRKFEEIVFKNQSL